MNLKKIIAAVATAAMTVSAFGIAASANYSKDPDTKVETWNMAHYDDDSLNGSTALAIGSNFSQESGYGKVYWNYTQVMWTGDNYLRGYAFTAPSDGTLTVDIGWTSGNHWFLSNTKSNTYYADDEKTTIASNVVTPVSVADTVSTYNVTEGATYYIVNTDIDKSGWLYVQEVIFTPAAEEEETIDAGFIFETTLEEIGSKTLSVTINDVTKTKAISELGTFTAGTGAVNIGIIITGVPKDAAVSASLID